MCFNDLHVLDLKSVSWLLLFLYAFIVVKGLNISLAEKMAALQMEWSRPKQHGVTPAPRAGHAGITVGENWFIVGGGDNKNGKCETSAHISYLFIYFTCTFSCIGICATMNNACMCDCSFQEFTLKCSAMPLSVL